MVRRMGLSRRGLGICSLVLTLIGGLLVLVMPGPGSMVPTAVAAPGDADVVTLTPARLLDTRPGFETADGEAAGLGRRSDGQVTELAVTGRGGVMADAVAAVVNVTAIKPDRRAFVTVFPCNGEPPNSSTLNVSGGVVRANGAIAQLSSTGTICLFTSRAMHLVVDVVGYLPVESPIVTLPPARLLDTREGVRPSTVSSKRSARSIRAMSCGCSRSDAAVSRSDAEAVLLNVAAIGGARRAFVTVWPCGSDQPNASTLNIGVGEAIANNAIAKVGAGGAVCLSASNSVELLVDASGYVPAGTDTTVLEPARRARYAVDG